MSLHELFNAVIDYRITAEGLGYAVVFVVVGLLGANAVGMTHGGSRRSVTFRTHQELRLNIHKISLDI